MDILGMDLASQSGLLLSCAGKFSCRICDGLFRNGRIGESNAFFCKVAKLWNINWDFI